MSVGDVLEHAVTVSPAVLVAVSSLLTMVTALVTNRLAGGHVKALTLLFLSVVAGIVAGWQENGITSFVVGDVAWTALSMFLTGTLMHYGLWRPVGVTGPGGVINHVMPRGIGDPMLRAGGYHAVEPE